MPRQIPCKFVRLESDRFPTTGSIAGGLNADLEQIALLRVGGVDVVVSSRRIQAHDRPPFKHLGVDLARCMFIVVNSSVHFSNEFETLAAGVILAMSKAASWPNPLIGRSAGEAPECDAANGPREQGHGVVKGHPFRLFGSLDL